jgi:hypothetical protein
MKSSALYQLSHTAEEAVSRPVLQVQVDAEPAVVVRVARATNGYQIKAYGFMIYNARARGLRLFEDRPGWFYAWSRNGEGK